MSIENNKPTPPGKGIPLGRYVEVYYINEKESLLVIARAHSNIEDIIRGSKKVYSREVFGKNNAEILVNLGRFPSDLAMLLRKDEEAIFIRYLSGNYKPLIEQIVGIKW